MKPIKRPSSLRHLLALTAGLALATGAAQAANNAPDLDGDGIPNIVDPDVDGDGIPNGLDDNVDGGIAVSGPYAGQYVGDHLRNDNPAELDIDGDGLADDSLGETDIDGDSMQDGFAVLVPRDPTRDDITVIVESSPDLQDPWTTLATSAAGLPFAGPGYVTGDAATPGVKSVEIRDLLNLPTSPRRFIRIRVSY